MPAGEEARLPFLARVHGATRALLTRCHCEAGFCPAQAQQAGEMGAEMGAELWEGPARSRGESTEEICRTSVELL